VSRECAGVGRVAVRLDDAQQLPQMPPRARAPADRRGLLDRRVRLSARLRAVLGVERGVGTVAAAAGASRRLDWRQGEDDEAGGAAQRLDARGGADLEEGGDLARERWGVGRRLRGCCTQAASRLRHASASG